MSDAAEARPWTGRGVALAVVAFFAVVIAANTTMTVFALKSWTGLVVPNSYVASQEFTDKTEARERAIAMGISHRLNYDGAVLHLQLTRAGHPEFAPEQVQITLGRPVTEAQDRLLEMLPVAGTAFEAATELGDGVWTGEISALVGTETWTQPIRLIVGGS
jgi:nitrogen fixation protein FixH